jgi:hypothetical protein
MEKKGLDYLYFEFGCEILTVNKRRRFALFSPLPSILRVPIPRLDFASASCIHAFSTC